MTKDVWIDNNRKFFRLDDGTVMHRPLTPEERAGLNHGDVEAFKLFMATEEMFGKDALKVISAFKKK